MNELKKYVGRPFEYGKHDCLQLMREFYLTELGIALPELDYLENNLPSEEVVIRRVYARLGFQLFDGGLNNLQYGDLIICAVGSAEGNHICVYIGENKVLHHLRNRNSLIEPLGALIRNTSVFYLRHPQVVLPEVTEKFDLLNQVRTLKHRMILNEQQPSEDS